ncbi:hypothetical protein PCE1_001730 [Barthelona sp. PCE]
MEAELIKPLWLGSPFRINDKKEFAFDNNELYEKFYELSDNTSLMNDCNLSDERISYLEDSGNFVDLISLLFKVLHNRMRLGLVDNVQINLPRLVLRSNYYAVQCILQNQYKFAQRLLDYAMELSARDNPFRMSYPERQSLRAVSLNNLAIIMRNRNRYFDACNYLKRAIKLESKVMDANNRGGTLLNCSVLLLQLGDEDLALNYAKKSVKIFEIELSDILSANPNCIDDDSNEHHVLRELASYVSAGRLCVAAAAQRLFKRKLCMTNLQHALNTSNAFLGGKDRITLTVTRVFTQVRGSIPGEVVPKTPRISPKKKQRPKSSRLPNKNSPVPSLKLKRPNTAAGVRKFRRKSPNRSQRVRKSVPTPLADSIRPVIPSRKKKPKKKRNERRTSQAQSQDLLQEILKVQSRLGSSSKLNFSPHFVDDLLNVIDKRNNSSSARGEVVSPLDDDMPRMEPLMTNEDAAKLIQRVYRGHRDRERYRRIKRRRDRKRKQDREQKEKERIREYKERRKMEKERLEKEHEAARRRERDRMLRNRERRIKEKEDVEKEEKQRQDRMMREGYVTKILPVARCLIQRNSFEKVRWATVKLQSMWRGRMDRIFYKNERKEKYDLERDMVKRRRTKAANIIADSYLSYRARKELNSRRKFSSEKQAVLCIEHVYKRFTIRRGLKKLQWAAKVIKKHSALYKAKLFRQQQKQAALIASRLYRGRAARKQILSMREEKRKREEAAVILQAHWRGRQVRKKLKAMERHVKDEEDIEFDYRRTSVTNYRNMVRRQEEELAYGRVMELDEVLQDVDEVFDFMDEESDFEKEPEVNDIILDSVTVDVDDEEPIFVSHTEMLAEEPVEEPIEEVEEPIEEVEEDMAHDMEIVSSVDGYVEDVVDDVFEETYVGILQDIDAEVAPVAPRITEIKTTVSDDEEIVEPKASVDRSAIPFDDKMDVFDRSIRNAGILQVPEHVDAFTDEEDVQPTKEKLDKMVEEIESHNLPPPFSDESDEFESMSEGELSENEEPAPVSTIRRRSVAVSRISDESDLSDSDSDLSAIEEDVPPPVSVPEVEDLPFDDYDEYYDSDEFESYSEDEVEKKTEAEEATPTASPMISPTSLQLMRETSTGSLEDAIERKVEEVTPRQRSKLVEASVTPGPEPIKKITAITPEKKQPAKSQLQAIVFDDSESDSDFEDFSD